MNIVEFIFPLSDKYKFICLLGIIKIDMIHQSYL